MEEFDYDPREEMEALVETLRRLVRRLTKQLWSTPRLTQMDVGKAIAQLQHVRYHDRIRLRRALAELLRELGKRRPDLHQHVVVIEASLADMEEELERPEWL
ncbi:MAG TPA: hypothetical protein VFI96_05695 [Longimicrobiaceae bacterium]|nr:hypothetical protein [Longimicrobiaceae bacterium]